MAISEQLDLISKEIGGKLDDNGNIEQQVQEIYDIIKSGAWPSGGGGSYELPTASTETKGGVKVGSGLRMVGEVLSVPFSSPDVKCISLVAHSSSPVVTIPANEYYATLTFDMSEYDLSDYKLFGVSADMGIDPEDLDSIYACPIMSTMYDDDLVVLLCKFGNPANYYGSNSYVVNALFIKDV